MLDTEAEPPATFSISLVPIAKAPLPHRCGPNALCAPAAAGPPRRAPYTYLGAATASPRNAEVGATGHAEPPRYRLEFAVPDLKPGTYAYVIYCDVCGRDGRGSLIAVPTTRSWRLRILAPDPRARIGAERGSALGDLEPDLFALELGAVEELDGTLGLIR
jgi:hypothetical protein